jgi:UDP-glucose 4-epimerase
MIFLVPDMPYYNVHGKPVLLTFLQIIRSAMRGDDLEIWGDPLLLRDYVYVDNLYNLLQLCLSSNLERGTFNVGTGEAVSTEKFIWAIKQIFDTKNRCNVIYRPEKTTYKCATYNISEQRKKLGYKPVLLNEMLELIRKELESRSLPNVWGWF